MRDTANTPGDNKENERAVLNTPSNKGGFAMGIGDAVFTSRVKPRAIAEGAPESTAMVTVTMVGRLVKDLGLVEINLTELYKMLKLTVAFDSPFGIIEKATVLEVLTGVVKTKVMKTSCGPDALGSTRVAVLTTTPEAFKTTVEASTMG